MAPKKPDQCFFEVLKQQGVIEYINATKGNNDESVVALHVKISVEGIPASAAAGALRATEADVINAFWNDEGEKRMPGLFEIPVDEFWEGAHDLRVSNLKNMRVKKLQKIKLWPTGRGMFDTVFTVTVEELPEGYAEALLDKMHSSCQINLEQTQRELDLGSSRKKDAQSPVKKVQGDILETQE